MGLDNGNRIVGTVWEFAVYFWEWGSPVPKGAVGVKGPGRKGRTCALTSSPSSWKVLPPDEVINFVTLCTQWSVCYVTLFQFEVAKVEILDDFENCMFYIAY